MSPFNLETCARPNILALQPYRCARDDYKDDGTNILLDANENAHGPALDTASSPSGLGKDILSGLHRYPDPHQNDLKQLLCNLRNTHNHTTKTLTPEHLFVGVGSDEAIDALLRCFCRPGMDQILTCPPTYGMYAVSAQVNDVEIFKAPLMSSLDFAIEVPLIISAMTTEPNLKLIYLCSPGNPTGSLLPKEDIISLLSHPTWNGIIVVDEAYIDFAPDGSSIAELVTEYPNLVVMQTLSKAFGMAGIRLGAAFTSPPIARLLNNLKAPYNISTPTSALACQALSAEGLGIMRRNRARIAEQRDRLIAELPAIPGVGMLRGGAASNFLLYEMLNSEGWPDNAIALAVYEKLAETRGVVVRFRGKESGCTGCLRITVGTEDEVTRFLGALKGALEEARAEAGKNLGKEEAANDVVA